MMSVACSAACLAVQKCLQEQARCVCRMALVPCRLPGSAVLRTVPGAVCNAALQVAQQRVSGNPEHFFFAFSAKPLAPE